MLRLVGARKKVRGDPRIEEMESFYEDLFQSQLGNVYFTLLENPELMPWTLVMPSWLTYEKAYEVAVRTLPLWVRNDLRFPASIDLRYEARQTQNGSYAIALSDGLYGDEKFRKMSAPQLIADGILGVTLLERIMLELWYYWKMSKLLKRAKMPTKHIFLDARGYATVCHGSRFTSGEVPIVRFHNRVVNIYGHQLTHVRSNIRPRVPFLLT